MHGIVVITSVTVLVILLSFFFFLLQRRRLQHPLPPGPPVQNNKLGHLGDIEKSGGLEKYLEKLHNEFGPVVTLFIGQNRLVSIASVELLKDVSKEFDRPLWLLEPWTPYLGRYSVNLSNGMDASHRVAQYARCLSGPGLKQHFPILNTLALEIAQTWLDCSKNRQEIEVLPSIKTFTLGSVIKCCFGDYFDNPETFAKLQNVLDMSWELFFKNLFKTPEEGESRQTSENTFEHLRAMVRKSYQDRKQSPYPKDEKLFIDLILNDDAKDMKKIDDLVTVLIGGVHNPSNLLMWCIYFIARHPDIQNKVLEEVMEELGEIPVDETNIKYLRYTMQVWQETLRHRFRAFTARIASSDMILNGYHVASKTAVLFATFIIHHDPSLYPDPQRFNPDHFSQDKIKQRPPFSFEPFGFAGNRRCVGYRFTDAEALTLIASLVRRFDIRLASEEEPEFIREAISMPEEPIKVSVTPRD